jgi:hypothetical protein
MGKTLDRLEFMAVVNERMRKEPFEKLFEDEDFTDKFLDFISSSTGRKWLSRPKGRKYVRWQESQ